MLRRWMVCVCVCVSYREGGEGEANSSEAVEGDCDENEGREYWRRKGRRKEETVK